MRNIWQIDVCRLQRIFCVPIPDFSQYLIISKRDAALCLYYVGIFFAFYTSLAPYCLWKFYMYEQYIAFFPVLLAFLMSLTLSVPLFNRKDYLLPFIAYCMCSVVMNVLGGKNLNGHIGSLFIGLIFLSLFMFDRKELERLGDALSASMGMILIPSMITFLLFLNGIHLPHFHIVGIGNYSYENYIFFLLDDRFATDIYPRFHSIFLEPSHMAMACIALLLTQVGRWKRWYNLAMFGAIILSFSLAGYLFLVTITFCASWMLHKGILKKLLVMIAGVSVIVWLSISYEGGDNLANRLIIERLAVGDDGKLEGDNRVTEGFEREYESFTKSDKFLFGEGVVKFERYNVSGNAGYRVFLYKFGLLSLIFLALFYLTFASMSTQKRSVAVMFLVSIMSFIPHGIPLKFYFFIPLYILTFRDLTPYIHQQQKP